jgi:hypothetical protein
MGITPTKDNGGASVAEQQTTKEKNPLFLALNDLVDKCNSVTNAKPADVKALRKMLNEMPELWRHAGDLARNARSQLLYDDIMAPAIQVAVEVGLKELEKEFDYELALPLERLLIEQILNCWVSHYLTEYKYNHFTSGNMSPETADYWEQRFSASQRRYLRAVESLAKVKKLLRPVPNPVQLNIADKQVNISK